MQIIKGLILSSAAGMVAMSGAHAADLPVKAKAVEYVRICSLYGAGFFYIPGTDTCIKIGGYLRADLTVHGGNSGQPFWSGDAGVVDRYENQYNDFSRLALTLDTRTATEYGVVRTFGQADFTFATEGVSNGINVSSSVNVAALQGAALNNFVGAGYLGVEYAFVQFAGFTLGKSASAFTTPWQGFPGNNTAFLVGGYDTVSGINNIQYSAQFGNGVSATIGLDDSSANDYNRTQVLNAIPVAVDSGLWGMYGAPTGNITGLGTSYSGTIMPDVVGNIRVDQAWGILQVSGALHDVTPGYWQSANVLGTQFPAGVGAALANAANNGHPDSKFGGAANVALQIKNLPTGAGDDLKLEASWSLGASKYVLGTSGSLPGSFYMLGDGPTGTAGKMAIGAISDGVYAGPAGPNQVPLQLTQGWGFRGAFNHNWNPSWSTSLFGGVAGLNYNSTAKNAWCAAYAANVGSFAPGAGYSCNPGFTMSEVGLTLRWTPVKDLTFSSEVLYAYLQTKMAGQATGTVSSAFPLASSAVYQYGNQGTVSVEFRAQRNF